MYFTHAFVFLAFCGCSFAQSRHFPFVTVGSDTSSSSKVDCGVRKNPNWTIDAFNTKIYESYPWQAALMTTGGVLFGSGVLLNADFVLTTAGKAVAHPIDDIAVLLGACEVNPVENLSKRYKARYIIRHGEYNPWNHHNDVAIIRLTESAPILSNPNINCAPRASAVPDEKATCYVAGWNKIGVSSDGRNMYKMTQVNVPIVNHDDCQRRLRNSKAVISTFELDRAGSMCAGGVPGKDICENSGGSPLVCQSKTTGLWEVVGLINWAPECATDVPVVYVNVPHFRTKIDGWLKSTG